MKQLLALVAALSPALSTHSEGLLDIIDAARSNESTYLIQQLNNRLNLERINTAWSFAYPNISLSSRSIRANNSSNSPGNTNPETGVRTPQNNRERSTQTTNELVITQTIYNQGIVSYSEESHFATVAISITNHTSIKIFYCG